jgi:hypothetical protein
MKMTVLNGDLVDGQLERHFWLLLSSFFIIVIYSVISNPITRYNSPKAALIVPFRVPGKDTLLPAHRTSRVKLIPSFFSHV